MFRRSFLHNHGLSIALGAIGLPATILGALWHPDLGLAQALYDLGIGLLTVLLFVLLTKRLIERGSPQSKSDE